ncbi:cyclase family protein [Streptantibioticus ferralitis]|uniref:Cyclase family protein n=1 Tax=Streptantibioticus ferralitis TaxID=236510 RepID=A0ABT5YWI0_9ACTN|nr:cyclase family protein [Streptantibioticus ferralitis]MDF2255953.1 cyclase family protein [Streptantibioticus ferralitis]
MDLPDTGAIASGAEDLPSNWGRWGEDDQRGTLNLITETARARGAAEVRTGRAVSLAVPIQPTPLISGPFAPSTEDASPVQQVMVYTGSPTMATADIMVVTNHHPRSTHVDALGHQARGGQVYPGRALAESVTPAGVRHGSTTAFVSGVVTRGVLLDLAADGPLPGGYAVTSRDLDAAEERQSVRLSPGTPWWSASGGPRRPSPAGRCRGWAWTRCGGCTGAACRSTQATSAMPIRRWTPPAHPRCTGSPCR